MVELSSSLDCLTLLEWTPRSLSYSAVVDVTLPAACVGCSEPVCCGPLSLSLQVDLKMKHLEEAHQTTPHSVKVRQRSFFVSGLTFLFNERFGPLCFPFRIASFSSYRYIHTD